MYQAWKSAFLLFFKRFHFSPKLRSVFHNIGHFSRILKKQTLKIWSFHPSPQTVLKKHLWRGSRKKKKAIYPSEMQNQPSHPASQTHSAIRCQLCLGGATVPPTGQNTHKLSEHWIHSSAGRPAVLPVKWKRCLLHPTPNIFFHLHLPHTQACICRCKTSRFATTIWRTHSESNMFLFFLKDFCLLLRPFLNQQYVYLH